ncbi:hypothetical protein BGZ72_009901 [Mortierella alpina]|nr:hypothetical protein BGZ72_009901 [Mortierella alpina]
MSPFVDWITTPENYERLYKPKALSGEKTVDTLKKIAEYVNSKDGTTWTGDTVKQKISYAKSQYTKAVQLIRKTGEGDDEDEETLQARKLELCPFFDRYHAVYSSNLTANPPPPRQSVSYPGERVIIESSPEASDFDDDPDQDYDDGYHGDLEGYLQDLKAQGAAAHMATNNSFSWEARENQHEAMLARRREEHEKMLQQRSKELDEVYDRRRRELDADKEAFAAKEQRLAADIAKHMQKMEAFQNKVETFQDERVRLFGENQRLASKLEAYNISVIKTPY